MAGDQTWNVRPGGVAISASTPMPTCHVSEPLARTLISANGYFGIKNMTQDISGMWRGTAIRYGYAQAVGFELDGDGRFALVGK
ncbi:MAG: hypothetical protein SFV21_11260 [Rhodospirillaceae bacterium]|nr:hypothetical protein [Rhodospirillaceae bacterium]